MHLKISGPLACGPEIEVSAGNSTHCVENELGLANFFGACSNAALSLAPSAKQRRTDYNRFSELTCVMFVTCRPKLASGFACACSLCFYTLKVLVGMGLLKSAKESHCNLTVRT